MPQRVYLYYEGERHEYFIKDGATVADVRGEVKNTYLLGGDDGKPDKKVVMLSFQGADLADDWRFQDIGVLPGSTIKIGEREEKRPRLYIECSHNNEIVKVMNDIDFLKANVGEIRTLASRKTGLPVGVFRLATPEGQEMFDCNSIESYGISIGGAVKLHTWDGWTDFLNLCTQGHTAQVFAHLSEDELISKYQMKVAMHMGCHFGHIDLVMTLMKYGARADDPVGYHPRRLWCVVEPHVDSLRPPIHVAALNGHVILLRTIVNYNICSISCKDGNEKTAFQVALMGKQKVCAGYLLGKQWSRISYGPPQLGVTLPLNVYSHLKNWCERARDKNFLANGPSKSTLKRKPYIKMEGTLVGLGVIVDGYSQSQMNGRAAPAKDQADDVQKRSSTFLILPEDRKVPDPKVYFKQVLYGATVKNNRGAKSKVNLKPLTKTNKADSAFDEVGFENDDEMGRREQGTRNFGGSRAVPPEQNFPARDSTRRMTYADLEQVFESEEGRVDSRCGSKLPPLGKQSRKSVAEDENKDDCYLETGKENLAKPKEKLSMPKNDKKLNISGSPPMKKNKVISIDYGIPLPLVNAEPTTRKFLLHTRSLDTDPAMSALTVYEKYRGANAHEYAIKCLSIANKFKDKPWLQQVRLAMDLTAQEVKKQLKEKNR